MADERFPQVAAYVRAAIERSSDRPAFRDLLLQLMSGPGRVLSPSGPVKWPAFVLYTCRALGGNATAAVGAAAAVEFIIASADVVDDLVDGDWDGGQDHRARALNASHGLTWLAHQCVSDLAVVLGEKRACVIGSIASQQAMRSCSGEDLDLALEGVCDATAEAAYDMTQLKSGSLVALACQVGAALATDDAEVLSLAGTLGTHIGVIAQLLNDIGGVVDGNDIRRRKKTLPIVYALRCAREEGMPEVLQLYSDGCAASSTDWKRLADTMRDIGALHYASVVAAAHRREAMAAVRELIRLTGRKEVASLRRLVPLVWAAESRRESR
ncbi:MAG: polyprenyl synthetase family protein [Chloroflexota bacterium]